MPLRQLGEGQTVSSRKDGHTPRRKGGRHHKPMASGSHGSGHDAKLRLEKRKRTGGPTHTRKRGRARVDE